MPSREVFLVGLTAAMLAVEAVRHRATAGEQISKADAIEEIIRARYWAIFGVRTRGTRMAGQGYRRIWLHWGRCWPNLSLTSIMPGGCLCPWHRDVPARDGE
jgi:hypothetical protein